MADMPAKKKLRKAFAPPLSPYTEERKKLRDAVKDVDDEEIVVLADLPMEGKHPNRKPLVYDAPSSGISDEEKETYARMDEDAIAKGRPRKLRLRNKVGK